MKQARREKGESYIGIFIFHFNRKKKVGQVNLGNRFFFFSVEWKEKEEEKKRGTREIFEKGGGDLVFLMQGERRKWLFKKIHTVYVCVCIIYTDKH
jgi:hypothetical protein